MAEKNEKLSRKKGEKFMTQEKLTRMVTGIVVAVTLLLAVLFGILVYQWIRLGVQGARLNELRAEGEALQQQIDEGEGILDGLLNDDEIKTDLAIQQGWVTDNN